MYGLSGRLMTAVAAEKKKISLIPTTGSIKKCDLDRDHASKKYSHVAFSPSQPLMALGSSDGSIVIIDTRTGKTASRFSLNGHLVGIGLAGKSLFGARGDTGEVVEWDLDSEEEKSRFVADEEGLSCLCVTSDESNHPLVAAARTGITVWRDKKRVSKYSGHASPVTCMAFLKGGALVSGNTQDRFLSVWPANTKKARHPIVTLTCAEPPKWLTCGAPLFEGDEAAVIALASSGLNAYIWRIPSMADDGDMPPKPANSCVSVGDKETLLACDFSRNEASIVCLLMGPSSLDPVLVESTVSSASADGGLLGEIKLSSKPPAESTDKATASNEAGDAKSTQKLKRLDRSAVITTTATEPVNGDAKRLRGTSNASVDDERPLMARLLEYSTRLGQVESGNETDAVSRVSAPSSLSIALEQALQTEDKDKIEAVLQTGDVDIISQTVSRLPSAKVAPLIRELAVRMQGKPGRASSLLLWMNAVMEHHAAFLTSDSVAREALKSIYAVADARVQTFDKLLRLKGRLDLILAKSNIGAAGGASTGARASSGPLVVIDGTKD